MSKWRYKDKKSIFLIGKCVKSQVERDWKWECVLYLYWHGIHLKNAVFGYDYEYDYS